MANSMMGSVRLEGSADSGHGVHLSGFHCENPQVPVKIQELSRNKKIWDIALHEENGWTTFLAAEWFPGNFVEMPNDRKISVYRREPHRFFLDLGAFIKSLDVCFIDQFVLTGSLGALTLTLVYRQAQAGV